MAYLPTRRASACVGFDADGTLTERGIFWDDEGRGLRRFDVRDGIAMQWAARAGLAVVVISGKDSPALGARLEELGVPASRACSTSRPARGRSPGSAASPSPTARSSATTCPTCR